MLNDIIHILVHILYVDPLTLTCPMAHMIMTKHQATSCTCNKLVPYCMLTEVLAQLLEQPQVLREAVTRRQDTSAPDQMENTNSGCTAAARACTTSCMLNTSGTALAAQIEHLSKNQIGLDLKFCYGSNLSECCFNPIAVSVKLRC